MISNERGGSFITAMLYLLAASFVVFVLLKVLPPYLDYYSMDDEVSQELRMSTINPDEVILQDLWAKAQERELPINKEDIVITHDGGIVSIDIKWVKEVDFGYGVKRDFAFEVKENNQKKEQQ